jgi:hypothetical protein
MTSATMRRRGGVSAAALVLLLVLAPSPSSSSSSSPPSSSYSPDPTDPLIRTDVFPELTWMEPYNATGNCTAVTDPPYWSVLDAIRRRQSDPSSSAPLNASPAVFDAYPPALRAGNTGIWSLFDLASTAIVPQMFPHPPSTIRLTYFRPRALRGVAPMGVHLAIGTWVICPSPSPSAPLGVTIDTWVCKPCLGGTWWNGDAGLTRGGVGISVDEGLTWRIVAADPRLTRAGANVVKLRVDGGFPPGTDTSSKYLGNAQRWDDALCVIGGNLFPPDGAYFSDDAKSTATAVCTYDGIRFFDVASLPEAVTAGAATGVNETVIVLGGVRPGGSNGSTFVSTTEWWLRPPGPWTGPDPADPCGAPLWSPFGGGGDDDPVYPVYCLNITKWAVAGLAPWDAASGVPSVLPRKSPVVVHAPGLVNSDTNPAFSRRRVVLAGLGMTTDQVIINNKADVYMLAEPNITALFAEARAAPNGASVPTRPFWSSPFRPFPVSSGTVTFMLPLEGNLTTMTGALAPEGFNKDAFPDYPGLPNDGTDAMVLTVHSTGTVLSTLSGSINPWRPLDNTDLLPLGVGNPQSRGGRQAYPPLLDAVRPETGIAHLLVDAALGYVRPPTAAADNTLQGVVVAVASGRILVGHTSRCFLAGCARGLEYPVPCSRTPWDSTCAPCAKCPAGFFVSRPCSFTILVSSRVPAVFDTACASCTDCEARGLVTDTPCGPTSDAVCATPLAVDESGLIPLSIRTAYDRLIAALTAIAGAASVLILVQQGVAAVMVAVVDDLADAVTEADALLELAVAKATQGAAAAGAAGEADRRRIRDGEQPDDASSSSSWALVPAARRVGGAGSPPSSSSNSSSSARRPPPSDPNTRGSSSFGHRGSESRSSGGGVEGGSSSMEMVVVAQRGRGMARVGGSAAAAPPPLPPGTGRGIPATLSPYILVNQPHPPLPDPALNYTVVTATSLFAPSDFAAAAAAAAAGGGSYSDGTLVRAPSLAGNHHHYQRHPTDGGDFLPPPSWSYPGSASSPTPVFVVPAPPPMPPPAAIPLSAALSICRPGPVGSRHASLQLSVWSAYVGLLHAGSHWLLALGLPLVLGHEDIALCLELSLGFSGSLAAVAAALAVRRVLAAAKSGGKAGVGGAEGISPLSLASELAAATSGARLLLLAVLALLILLAPRSIRLARLLPIQLPKSLLDSLESRIARIALVNEAVCLILVTALIGRTALPPFRWGLLLLMCVVLGTTRISVELAYLLCKRIRRPQTVWVGGEPAISSAAPTNPPASAAGSMASSSLPSPPYSSSASSSSSSTSSADDSVYISSPLRAAPSSSSSSSVSGPYPARLSQSSASTSSSTTAAASSLASPADSVTGGLPLSSRARRIVAAAGGGAGGGREAPQPPPLPPPAAASRRLITITDADVFLTVDSSSSTPMGTDAASAPHTASRVAPLREGGGGGAAFITLTSASSLPSRTGAGDEEASVHEGGGTTTSRSRTRAAATFEAAAAAAASVAEGDEAAALEAALSVLRAHASPLWAATEREEGRRRGSVGSALGGARLSSSL